LRLETSIKRWAFFNVRTKRIEKWQKKRKYQQMNAAESLKTATEASWQALYTHGGQDPFHEDGVNMNLVRNHILYYRRQIEESFPPEEYPIAYKQPVPEEVENSYMARKDEIMANAKQSLAAYEADESYKFILSYKDNFSNKTLEKIYA
jgi:hypothetical protein